MQYIKIAKIKQYPVVCNIPHSSIVVPGLMMEDFDIDKKDFKQEVLKLADLYTDELFAGLLTDYAGVVAKVSRVATDIERFENDKQEVMARVGMGALYTNSTAGEVIRKFNAKRRGELLNIVYRPYHKQLTTLTAESLKKFKQCVILDCHSFPSIPDKHELNQSLKRKDIDICLGVDDFHTPNRLYQLLKKNFELAGFSVKKNNPYIGTIVPLKYYRKDKQVASVMIEINRKLYMNEKTFKKLKGFEGLKKKIENIVLTSLEEYLK